MHRTKKRSRGGRGKNVGQKLLAAAAHAAFPGGKNELLHTMSAIENDEAKSRIWQQLKTKLHSTMVAFGSGSVQLPKLMDTFRHDWGSELTSYAVQLGFGCNDAAVYKMLLTMPDEIESGFISATGTFAFKVIPKAETSENLTKIDQSNQYQDEMRRIFARRRASMSSGFHRSFPFNHSFHVRPPVRMPPPPPPMPFNLSAPILNGPQLPGLVIQLPNCADAQRRVSLTNGFHPPPPYFVNSFPAQPSARPQPFAMSSPNPKPARGPPPSMLHKQIENILRSSRNRLPPNGHPPIVRKISIRSQVQQVVQKELQAQVVQEDERSHDLQKPKQSSNAKDESEDIIGQLIEQFKRLKLSE
ncbi:hypothetical protein niasHT_024014 [Heterodera trifolii]|uniref:Uncharacterized protein n=1 Tax=Heterodera trifolii TaxID=157864 RepID=A0ABD2KQD9_9BILA